MEETTWLITYLGVSLVGNGAGSTYLKYLIRKHCAMVYSSTMYAFKPSLTHFESGNAVIRRRCIHCMRFLLRPRFIMRLRKLLGKQEVKISLQRNPLNECST